MAARQATRPRDVYVTPLDVALLSALEATRSIVSACARISITRDTGMYRLRRLTRALSSPVVVSRRGGSTRGDTSLTGLGRRILVRGAGPLPPAAAGRPRHAVEVNVVQGTWRARPLPHVSLGGGLDLFVSFGARDGQTVRVAIEPEAIVVARGRFRSSARNVIPGTIESVRHVDAMRALLRIRVGRDAHLDAAVTPRSAAQLVLKPGARVFLYLKATAVLPLA